MPVRVGIVLLLLALGLAACGARAPHSAAPGRGSVSAAFAGAPPPLAALHARADELVGGGTKAFATLLAGLRGYPVVVNKWASWCDPCQVEFPSFQRATLAFARSVAFVGIDGKDHDQAAAAFLRRFPVTYPSYTDPDEAIARRLKAASYYPQTIFFDRGHQIVFDHLGPYLSATALEADVRRYALR